MGQLRTVIQYKPKEIQKHLVKLRAELNEFKRRGDHEREMRWLGAICMLEDMNRKGGRMEVWSE